MGHETIQSNINQNYSAINPDFAYFEKYIYGKRTCSIVFGIFFLIIAIGVCLYEYFGENKKEVGIYMGILGALVFMELFVCICGMGIKICIDNLNQLITIKPVSLIPCGCCGGTYRYTELNSIECDYQRGTAYASITSKINTKEVGKRKVFTASASGACTGECNCLGVEPDFQSTINLANELIRQANQVNLPIYT